MFTITTESVLSLERISSVTMTSEAHAMKF